MKLTPEILQLEGAILVSTLPGIGSLVSLNFCLANDYKMTLWMGLADWDFILNDKDVVSSDSYVSRQNLHIEPFIGSKILEIHEFADDEIHFYFENNGRLAIWENVRAYGVDERSFFNLFEWKNDVKHHVFSYPYVD